MDDCIEHLRAQLKRLIRASPRVRNRAATSIVFGQIQDAPWRVRVAFSSTFDKGPADWREYHPGILASYCVDTDIKLWTYKHENLEFAGNPYVPGDRVIKTSHSDPNTAVVVECGDDDENPVTVAYLGDFDDEGVWPSKLAEHCEENGIKCYTYSADELAFDKAT